MVKNVAIVSLSSGIIGEDFVGHEVALGLKRLRDFGLNVKMMPHAQKGLEYVKEHPEERAEDLLAALSDDSVDMILCAIGGDDTYRLLPYLFEGDRLRKAAKQKIFLGFSDSTFNHLMLHKVGIRSFYGQAFLPDLCELDAEMLPYSARFFEELIRTGGIREIRPSGIWYENRTDWSPAALGTARVSHPNSGFRLLQGPSRFSGKILGGCLDSLYDVFDNGRYADTVSLCEKYGLFPSSDDWRGRILLLETSEETPDPEKYRSMLTALKKTGIFSVISGILCGKPMDGLYEEDFNRILPEVVDDPDLPILVNLSVGHAAPRAIVPFGVEAFVDAEEQVIRFAEPPKPSEEGRPERK